MRRIVSSALFVSFLFAGLAIAQEPTSPPTLDQALALVRAWADAQRTYEGVPAMSIAIVRDQERVWSGGFGSADPATGRPATDGTLYSICSVSKLFTSVGVMQLRDEGKIRLDDPVAKHLAWFTLPPAEGGGPVTVEGLLTHASGLPRESDYPYWSGEFEFPTHEQIVERIGAQPPLYRPFTYHQYSNLGLTLAGELIAAKSGEPYDRYIRTRILEPLGMRDTFTDMPESEKGKRLAVGHSAKRRDGTRATLPFFTARGVAPAAGFASTVNDLAKFASWQFRLLEKGGTEVLDANTLREMHRPHWVDPDFELFWGLGFATRKRGDTVYVGHGGSCPGYRTALSMIPADKIAVTVMANASGTDVERYAAVIHDIVRPLLKKKEPASSPAPGADLAPYAGSYEAFPWWGEILVVPWGDHLAAIDVPTTDLLQDKDLLRKVGEHTFRRVRKDGTLGETVVFEMGADGKAASIRWHSNVRPRMK